jgi:hypothetical protein
MGLVQMEVPAMKLPRLRFTVRRMMTVVALAGVVMAWANDRAKKGYPLVVFEYTRLIDNEPLINPMRLESIENGCFVFENGLIIRFEAVHRPPGMIGLQEECPVGSVLDVETGAGGTVTVHKLRGAIYCRNAFRSRPLTLHLSLFPRNVYRNHRALIGTGTILKPGATSRS